MRGGWPGPTEARRCGLGLCLLALYSHAILADPKGIRSRVEIGFDSYLQQFHLSDAILPDLDPSGGYDEAAVRDTTDIFREFRTQVEFELFDDAPSNRMSLRARASAGTESNREGGSLEARLGAPSDRTRLDLFADFEARQFRDGGDYELQSDVYELNARLSARRRVSESTELGLRLRGWNESYEAPSEFEQDQRRLDVSATFDSQVGFDLSHSLEAGLGWREYPDTTQISSDRFFALDDFQWRGRSWFASLHSGGERRVFHDADVRSPYWNFFLEPDLGRGFGERWRLSSKSLLESLDYDRNSSVYFDYLYGQSGLELSYASLGWSLAFEPRWSWLSAAAEVEDRFQQPSLVARFDWFGPGRVWASLSEEIGWRDYGATQDDLDLYSDYWFLRSTLLLSVRLNDWLQCDAFVSDEPEKHERPLDEGRLTLFNASLRATF